MKRLLLVLTMGSLALAACNKQDGTPTAVLNEKIDTTTARSVMIVNNQAGTFIGGTVTGNVKIYRIDGKYSLALENFNTANGPDLHVYLSKQSQPVDFIDLGKLKSTSGNQVYEIKGLPDFAVYKYAVIHCQQYNHWFGSAEIK